MVVVVACKKDEPAAPPRAVPKPPVVADAAVATPDAPRAALIDLGKSVPLEIVVSSTVDNPAILPAHLVDRDPSTAWNSKTNELEGAWIDVAAPPGATISELRFSVGHTGRGKKNEDYFTMNPRIAKVAISTAIGTDNVVIGEYKLDIANRGLQTVAFKPHRQVRLQIVDVVPGSKKTWRETCVGELEAWGTPQPAFAPPAKALTPTVTVFAPPPPSANPCAEVEAHKLEREKQHEASKKYCESLDPDSDEAHFCGVDEAGEPECTSWSVDIDKIGAFASSLTVTCELPDNIYGDMTCTITEPSGGQLAQLVGNKHMSVEKITASEADGRLALRIATTGDRVSEYLVVCRTDKCSDPIPLAGDDWRVKAKVQGAIYSTSKETGAPPDDSIVTSQPLFK